MKKYKINYISNNKILSSLYVKSETYPKIPNFDNQKYFILEQVQNVVEDLIVIDVILSSKITIDTLEVFYNNEIIGKSNIINNNTENKITLENNFFEQKYLETELKINENNEFYGIIPSVGYEIEYTINKDYTKLFINEEKIHFEHTTGEIYLDENSTLKGLTADEGYYISKLNLLKNNKIDFEIRQTGTLHKQELLNSLNAEFKDEKFLETNKILIGELLEKDKKTLSEKNLSYFKTQIKQNSKIKKIETQANFDEKISQELDNQITSLVDNVIKEIQNSQIEEPTLIEEKEKKSLFSKIFKK